MWLFKRVAKKRPVKKEKPKKSETEVEEKKTKKSETEVEEKKTKKSETEVEQSNAQSNAEIEAKGIDELIGVPGKTPSEIGCWFDLRMESFQLIHLTCYWYNAKDVCKKKGNIVITRTEDDMHRSSFYCHEKDKDSPGDADTDEAGRAALHERVYQYYVKNGGHNCEHSIIRAEAWSNSLASALQLNFDFLGIFDLGSYIFKIDAPYPDSALSCLAATIHNHSIFIVSLEIGQEVTEAHVKIIDAAYSQGCKDFAIRHLKKVGDNVEFTFDWILRSRIFAPVFGKGSQGHARYQDAVKAIHHPDKRSSEFVQDTSPSTDNVVVKLFLKESDLAQYGKRHLQHYLVHPP